MRKVERYFIRFVCSNGRMRYCGQDGHMPYQREAAELYTTPRECYDRMEQIPRTHLMRHTTPEILSRKVLVEDTSAAPTARRRFALPGLQEHI